MGLIFNLLLLFLFANANYSMESAGSNQTKFKKKVHFSDDLVDEKEVSYFNNLSYDDNDDFEDSEFSFHSLLMLPIRVVGYGLSKMFNWQLYDDDFNDTELFDCISEDDFDTEELSITNRACLEKIYEKNRKSYMEQFSILEILPDPVCNEEVNKEIRKSLCQEVLKDPYFAVDLGIKFDFYSESNFECEPHTIEFNMVKNADDIPQIIEQEMFYCPTYSKNEMNYGTYFISQGYAQKTVFVYIEDFNRKIQEDTVLFQLYKKNVDI